MKGNVPTFPTGSEGRMEGPSSCSVGPLLQLLFYCALLRACSTGVGRMPPADIPGASLLLLACPSLGRISPVPGGPEFIPDPMAECDILTSVRSRVFLCRLFAVGCSPIVYCCISVIQACTSGHWGLLLGGRSCYF